MIPKCLSNPPNMVPTGSQMSPKVDKKTGKLAVLFHNRSQRGSGVAFGLHLGSIREPMATILGGLEITFPKKIIVEPIFKNKSSLNTYFIYFRSDSEEPDPQSDSVVTVFS